MDKHTNLIYLKSLQAHITLIRMRVQEGRRTKTPLTVDDEVRELFNLFQGLCLEMEAGFELLDNEVTAKIKADKQKPIIQIIECSPQSEELLTKTEQLERLVNSVIPTIRNPI